MSLDGDNPTAAAPRVLVLQLEAGTESLVSYGVEAGGWPVGESFEGVCKDLSSLGTFVGGFHAQGGPGGPREGLLGRVGMVGTPLSPMT